jgi:hypothetical protein
VAGTFVAVDHAGVANIRGLANPFGDESVVSQQAIKQAFELMRGRLAGLIGLNVAMFV